MKRLLGYVVKLSDGTRSPRTPKPLPVIGDAVDAWIGSPGGSYVVPVFAVRRPAVVPPLAQALAIASIVDKPKPAPAEGAGLPAEICFGCGGAKTRAVEAVAAARRYMTAGGS